MTERLGDRIRKARERYGMSQAELARRIGISKNSMNLIEASKTPDPAASKVKAIADVLRVSTDYLLGRKDEDSERVAVAVA
jgi:transcriptional regulator with XRE-family HTH domain